MSVTAKSRSSSSKDHKTKSYRDIILDEIWERFKETAVGGLLDRKGALQVIHAAYDSLSRYRGGIDELPAVLDHHEFGFDDLVAIIDQFEGFGNERARGGGEMLGFSDESQQQIIELGPIDYFAFQWKKCFYTKQKEAEKKQTKPEANFASLSVSSLDEGDSRVSAVTDLHASLGSATSWETGGDTVSSSLERNAIQRSLVSILENQETSIQVCLSLRKGIEWLDIGPRQILFAALVFFMSCAACGILIAMSELWLEHLRSSETSYVDQFASMLISLTESFESTFTASNGNEMEKQIVAFGVWTEALFHLDQDMETGVDRWNAKIAQILLESIESNVIQSQISAKTAVQNLMICAAPVANSTFVNALDVQFALLESMNTVSEPTYSPFNFSVHLLLVSGQTSIAVAESRLQCVDSVRSGLSDFEYSLRQEMEEGECSLLEQWQAKLSGSNNDVSALIVNSTKSYSLAVFRSKNTALNYRKNELVEIVDYANNVSLRTTEFVLAGFNETTGKLIPQITLWRFLSGCMLQCERFSAAAKNIVRVFDTLGSTWAITPDYRPQPVVGAFSYLAGLDMALGIERDVEENRLTSRKLLTHIADSINYGIDSSFELELVGYKNPMPFFFNTDPCPPHTDCLKTSAGDIYFQFGCQDCLRVETAHFDAFLDHFTRFKKTVACNGNCTHFLGSTSIQTHFSDEAKHHTAHYTHDYAHDEVLCFSGEISNYSATLIVKEDVGDFTNPVQTRIAISVLVTVVILIFGIVVVMIVLLRLLGNVEKQWKDTEAQQVCERKKLEAIIDDLLPHQLSSGIISGQHFVAEGISAAFVMVDICDFSELIRSWLHYNVVRTMSYIFGLILDVAHDCGVLKTNIIGDSFVGFARRVIEINYDEKRGLHPTRRVSRFAVAILTYFSSRFAHFPQNSEVFGHLFADYKALSKPLPLPKVRLGAHYGAAVWGAVDCNRGVLFDCFGPSLAITRRLVDSSEPHRFVVSAAFREALAGCDPRKEYTFFSGKKMVTRTHGTLITHLMRSSKQTDIQDVANRHGIVQAPVPFPLDPQRQKKAYVASEGVSRL